MTTPKQVSSALPGKGKGKGKRKVYTIMACAQSSAKSMRDSSGLHKSAVMWVEMARRTVYPTMNADGRYANIRMRYIVVAVGSRIFACGLAQKVLQITSMGVHTTVPLSCEISPSER